MGVLPVRFLPRRVGWRPRWKGCLPLQVAQGEKRRELRQLDGVGGVLDGWEHWSDLGKGKGERRGHGRGAGGEEGGGGLALSEPVLGGGASSHGSSY